MDDRTGAAEAAPSATAAPAVVPFWLLRLGALGWRVLVIVAFVLVVVALAGTLGTVTASVAVAFLASATVSPLVRRARARGSGGGATAAVGTVLVFGTIILVLGVGAWVLVRYGPELIVALQDGVDALRDDGIGGWLPAAFADALADLLDGGLGWLAGNVGTIVGNIANVASILLFGAFTTFYVLQDAGKGWRWATQALSDGHRAAADRHAATAIEQVGGYLRRVAILAALEAAVVLLATWGLGVPLAIPLATLTFAGGFIPYLGGLVATAVVLLVALATVGPELTLVLLGVLLLANVVLDRVVAQPLQRGSARINPGIVVIALPIGAALAGLFGLVMAVPVAAAILAIGTSIVDIVRPEEPVDADAHPPLVPPWLDVLAQWSWRLLVGLGLIGLGLIAVLQVPILILPIVVAAVLAATFAPLVGGLVRRGWRASLAAAVVTVGVTGAIVVVTGLAIAGLAANVGDLVGGMLAGVGDIDEWLQGLGGLLQQLVGEIGDVIARAVVTTVASVAGVLAILVVGVILTFFVLRDGRAAWGRLVSHTSAWRRRELDAAAERAVGVLGSYMLGTGAVSLFGAATQWLLMVILGVPLALPVFVLSFFGGYIPYIGSILTTGIAFLLTVTTGDPLAIAVMGVFTMVFNIVQGNVVQPLVFSRAVHIHPAIVLLAIPAGGALGGIIGMFLVVPFLGVVAATWRTVLVVLGQPPTADVVGAGNEPAAEAAPAAVVEADPA